MAEERLGIVFPESYKWWLMNYGGGCIYGDEVFSIYELDFDTVVGGDIVYMHELHMRKRLFSENMLVICNAYQGDALFYFDITKQSEEGEYPVYEYYTKQLYANDFIGFLKKFILEE